MPDKLEENWKKEMRETELEEELNQRNWVIVGQKRTDRSQGMQ